MSPLWHMHMGQKFRPEWQKCEPQINRQIVTSFADIIFPPGRNYIKKIFRFLNSVSCVCVCMCVCVCVFLCVCWVSTDWSVEFIFTAVKGLSCHFSLGVHDQEMYMFKFNPVEGIQPWLFIRYELTFGLWLVLEKIIDLCLKYMSHFDVT